MTPPIFVGVLHLVIVVPGARSRKDRRQVIRSLRDRIRHRFEVTFNEVGEAPRPLRGDVVITTAGGDSLMVRSVLDRVRSFVESSGRCLVGDSALDVFRWSPPERFFVMEDGEDG